MPTTLTITLLPHPSIPNDPAIARIEVSIGHQAAGCLTLNYRLFGDPEQHQIPPCKPAAACDGLWQHTCCELFIATVDGTKYEEFNFSPSGQWAHYQFDDYRVRSLEPKPTIAPEISFTQLLDGFELRALLPHKNLPARTQLGVSAVIESVTGNKTYWALAHGTPQPDFHHRQSFCLALPA